MAIYLASNIDFLYFPPLDCRGHGSVQEVYQQEHRVGLCDSSSQVGESGAADMPIKTTMTCTFLPFPESFTTAEIWVYQDEIFSMDLLSALIDFVKADTDPENLYRAVVGIGNLVSAWWFAFT